MSTRQRAYVAWIVVCLVWGTTYLAIRLAIDTLPPLLMTSVRWVIAGTLLLAAVKFSGESLPPRSSWTALAVLGILLIGFGNGAVVWAEQVLPSGLTAVLVAITPFWMIAIERLMPDGEALTSSRVAGLIVGFAGVVILVWPELRTDSGPRFLAGVAATQMACIGWSTGSSYIRRRKDEASFLAVSSLQMIFGGLFLLVAAVLRGESIDGPMSPASLGAFVYLVFVGSIVGFSAYGYALKHLPLSTVSLYAYINPIIAVGLGTLILSEPLTPRLIVASAMVLCGVAVVKH